MTLPVPIARVVLAALAVVAALAAAAPADARTGQCLPGQDGPRCEVWKGKVTFVADGDTLDVDVHGDGMSRAARVRVTGVNAMEQSVYSRTASKRRGDCHALEATARVERLVRKARGRVRLAALDPASRSKHRLRRAVSVRIGGRWVDIGATLLREGHALWLPNKREWAWNSEYRVLAAGAAAKGRRLWDPTACGADPRGSVDLSVNWDAPGRDDRNVNGEWVRIHNRDLLRTLSLEGWRLRDSRLGYRFKPGTVVPPGGWVRVRVGRGTDFATELFWGLGKPIFDNATHDARAMGDGAYLFDPRGALRAWEQYPAV